MLFLFSFIGLGLLCLVCCTSAAAVAKYFLNACNPHFENTGSQKSGASKEQPATVAHFCGAYNAHAVEYLIHQLSAVCSE